MINCKNNAKGDIKNNERPKVEKENRLVFDLKKVIEENTAIYDLHYNEVNGKNNNNIKVEKLEVNEYDILVVSDISKHDELIVKKKYSEKFDHSSCEMDKFIKEVAKCVFDEKPIFDPKEFKKMLEKAEPSLRGLNNKFINGVKVEIGLLLDASGASLPTIVTLASTGLMTLFNFGAGFTYHSYDWTFTYILNSREMVFLLNYNFFDLLFHAVFGHNKVLAKKPKPYKINLILEIVYQGWSQVRPIVIQKSERSKDPEVRYLVNLLDNIVPLVLDFYPIIFHSGNWEAYIEAMFHNIDGSKAISSDTSSKPKAYEFPMLKTQVDINIMSMAWNTACIPQNDRFCDFEDCIDSSEKNCKAFQKTLELSDKKAKKKDSDNSEVIEASDDTSNESFFLDANVDYSNVVYLLRKLKIL
ncbi:hypothetical protein C2G38_2248046 [Gigaspora rosea]|uniref:Uncharacterized protein n=1 Tax=Gigaspora rosea TaxID=44941 RepID=A0A397V150_9GLOM|nr:hypothetical protein C2G38_2248046 [Gigaspora rosea]